MYVELILGMTMYMYYMFYWMRFCEKEKLNDMQDEWSLLKKCLHGVKTFYFRIYIYFPLFADIRYGFKLETPKRALHCSVESEEEKFNWISLLEQAIRSAIDLQWCVIIRLRTPSVLEALPQSMNLYLEKLLAIALNYINKHCFTHI